MKLALGTVQFGLDYGISNQQGQVSTPQITEILTYAKQLGINTLDCAGAYGNSEKRLGQLCRDNNFKVISKIPALRHDEISIKKYVEQSLADLLRDNIESLLFHHADDLLSHPNKQQFFNQLKQLKTQSIVKTIGVSVYSPEQLSYIIKHYLIDIAQVPINIFDQRFISEQLISLCVSNNIKLHARSLFLQGLIFIDEPYLSPYFAPFKEKLQRFSQLAKYLSCSKLTLALSILAQDLLTNDKATKVVEKLVVGVCNKAQLAEIVTAYEQAKTLNISKAELLSLSDTRLELINPSLWKV